MKIQNHYQALGCVECANGSALDFDFTMAFQPIVNVKTRTVFAHEALVRGLNGESAGAVFEHVNDDNRYRFDQVCRVKAISLASQLAMPCFLSINFMPNAVYQPELCIRTTLEAARRFGFPIDRIIFEITEGEKVDDIPHVRGIVDYYKQQGFLTAIDDFGAGYSGLNLLAEIQPNLIKLDMALIRNIDKDKGRRVITKGIIQVSTELGIDVIAEGIETYEELQTLRELDVDLCQGFFFAKAAFQSIAEVPFAAYELR